MEGNSFMDKLLNYMLAWDGALAGQGETITDEGMAGGMGGGQREEQGPLTGGIK